MADEPNKPPKIQLSTLFMVGIIAVSFLASMIIAAFWMASEHYEFRVLSQQMASRYIDTQRNLLQSEVGRVIDHLHESRNRAETRLKKDIRSRTGEAHALAQRLVEQYRDRLPEDDIRTMVVEALRAIRFNDGRGYFFVVDVNGMVRLLGDRPEVEGRNLLDMQNSDGRYIVRDMIALARDTGEGFYRYNWTKPGGAGSHHPKIAFIKYFEPFKWIIGTGEYLTDVENDIKAEAIERIEQITFGKEGYIFVGTYDGVSLAKPAKNRNMWHVEDENGVKIVQELIAAARSGGGFVNYVMPKFPGLPSAPKLSYADSFDPWQWYVGAGIYIDDIDATLNDMRAALKASIRHHLIMIGITLTGVIVLTIVVVRLFTGRLIRNIRSFNRFFDQASSEHIKIDTADINFQEFEHLAESANQMVDERREMDRALNESLQWNQTILNAVQSGIVVIDASAHRVVDVNPAAADMIGLPREAIIDRSCNQFICPSEKGRCPIVEQDHGVRQEERTLVKQDGTEIPILKTVSRIDIGDRPYLIEGFLDISKQKKLESELQQAYKMEAIGTLTGGIAHDFNNILGIILGNVELVESVATEHDKVVKHIKVTKEAVLRAKKIVSQLLSYSRQTTADKHPVSLTRVAQETVSFIKALIPTSITVTPEITNQPCQVTGNATQISQALINLCVNSSHAVDKETGVINIRVGTTTVLPGEFDRFPSLAKGPYAEVVVGDNGHGIDPAIMDRIFDPYFTTKGIGKGTGMGLSVVMGIVQDHGGAISIESRPGKGTTARMVFPLVDIAPDDRLPVESSADSAGDTEKILFIDDEPQLVELAQALLTHLNYRVEGHQDAAAAMERFRAAPEAYDLIISDMSMPSMSGSQVIAAARGIRPDIPVIICSGYSESMDEGRAREMNCIYVQKPIDMQSLTEAVRIALGKT